MVPSWRKRVAYFVFINLICIALILISVEGAARAFLVFTRGTSTIGLRQRTRYLQYQPFVMFGENWDTQLDPSRYPKAPGPRGKYRILLLGGSAAADFPPQILEAAFAEKFKNREFEVINAAYGGYNARQELILASIWAPPLAPDMIISLDGSNDLELRLRTKRSGTFYPDSAYELALTRPFLTPLAHLLRYSQAVQGMQRFVAHEQIGSVDKYVDAIPVYLSAQHSLNALARGLPATRIIVLQPFRIFKHPLSEAEKNFQLYRYREAVMRQLYDMLHQRLQTLAQEDRVLYVNGCSAFDGHTETIFSDDVHFLSDEGYRLLAKHIVHFVTEEMLQK